MAELKLNAQSTWIPLSSAVVLAMPLLAAWNEWRMTQDRIAALEARPAATSVGDRWTCLDHERYMALLAKLNPKLNIPALPKVCEP